MKRKIVRAIILGLTVCSLAILFTACGKKKEHQHNFGEWTVTEEATCTENGTQMRFCKCGAFETDTIFKTGHKGGESTCQQKAVCEVCGVEYGEYADHNFADEYTIDSEPTCTMDGEKSRHCLTVGCGVRTDRETIYAPGHNYGEWETQYEASCTLDGMKKRTCSECGNVETEFITETGHDFGEWTVIEEATCTLYGEKKHTCSKCGSFETESIVPTGHNYGELIARVEPTCIQNGTVVHYHCDKCNKDFDESKTEVLLNLTIPATGHKGGVATCSQKAVCEVCHEEYGEIDTTNHNYTEWEITTVATCTVKQVETEKCAWCHNLGTQTKEGNTNPDNHDYTDTVISPTCDKKGYTKHSCKTCNYTYNDNYVDTIAHVYGEWHEEIKATCTKTGTKGYYYCDNCKKNYDKNNQEILDLTIEKTAHTPKTAVEENKVNATCTENGSYDEVVYCEVCNEEISRTAKTIEHTGHSYGKMIAKVEPTCTETGMSAYYKCSVCEKYFDDVKSEKTLAELVISAKGHQFSEDWTNGDENDCIYHWHKATCEHTDLISGKECHTFEEIDEQYKCSKCGYVGIKPTEKISYFYDETTDCYICKGRLEDTSTEENINIVIASVYNDGIHGVKPVTRIGEYAFAGWNNLATVVLPNGLLHINKNAFSNCKNLYNVSIPESILHVDVTAFNDTNINFKTENGCSYLKVGDNEYFILMSIENKDITTFTFNENTKIIADMVFEDCEFLRSVEIPASIKSIGEVAFFGCKNLASVTFNGNVQYIGSEAFGDCSALTSVELPDGLTVIENRTFYGCSNLTNVIIPSSVKSIGHSLFVNCPKFKTVYYKGIDWKNVEIDDWYNEILLNSAVYCYSEEKPTEMGNFWYYLDGVPTVWEECEIFGHAYGELVEKKETTCTETGWENHYKCSVCEKYFDENKVETTWQEISTLAVGHKCVDNHTWIHTCLVCGPVKVLDISEDGKTVNGLTEYGKTVSYIAIPDGVITIADEAFDSCTTMKCIEIPSTVTTLGMMAFYGTNVEKVYLGNLENYCKIKSDYFNRPFMSGADLYLDGELVENLVVPDGVTSVKMLNGCTSIKTVTLGNGFTSVETYFSDFFPNLTTVTLNEATNSLDTYSFVDCSNLEKIVIKNPTTYFAIYSIIGCQNLKTIEFNGTVSQWKACVNGVTSPICDVSPYCIISCTDGDLDINGNVL